MAKVKVGISSCLLGQAVRYDGGHKRSALCLDELARYFDFVPTCPEAGAGLGVPRPPMRLVGDAAAPRAVRIDRPGEDYNAALQRYAEARISELQELCGYIFIRNSPSCGLYGVPVYTADGSSSTANGRGLFAAALCRALPQLPVEEEGRLQDAFLRERFIERVLAYHAVRQQDGGTSGPALA